MTTSNVASDLAAVATSLRRITVRVQDERGRGAGSGVVWNDDGLVITNAHVATGRRAAIADAGGRSVRATVERRDPERDLAALRIEGGAAASLDVAVATVRDRRSVRAGEVAVAVGNPLGLIGALTAGVVQRCNDRWVIADVRLAPGNSGGPLADSAGRVLGINSMIAGRLALAVPANAVAAFLDGDRSRPRLGVVVIDMENRSVDNLFSRYYGQLWRGGPLYWQNVMNIYNPDAQPTLVPNPLAIAAAYSFDPHHGHDAGWFVETGLGGFGAEKFR